MSNPESQIPSAQLPLYGEQIVEPETGNATALFHRFLLGIFDRTGGAQGASTSDATQIAQTALTTAEGALSAAQLAQSTATSAQSSAAAAQASATAASTLATGAGNLATNVQNQALLKVDNLAGLNSRPISRQSLGLNSVALNFSFDTITASLKRGLPILQGMTIAANCAGSVAWAGIGATSDTVATFQVYRGGVYLPFAQMTFVHSGLGYNFSIQPAFTLQAGDVVVVQWPLSPDATLAEVTITLSASLT